MIVRDGAGGDKKARVDSDHRLYVQSSGVSEEHESSLVGGRSYSVTLLPMLFQSGMNSPVILIRNDSGLNLVVTEVVAGSDAWVQVGTQIDFRKNVVIGSLGNITEYEPVSMNSSFSDFSGVETWLWNGGGTGISGVSGGTVIQSTMLGYEPHHFPFGQSLIIGEGKTFAVDMRPPGVTTPLFHCTIRFYLKGDFN